MLWLVSDPPPSPPSHCSLHPLQYYLFTPVDMVAVLSGGDDQNHIHKMLQHQQRRLCHLRHLSSMLQPFENDAAAWAIDEAHLVKVSRLRGTNE